MTEIVKIVKVSGTAVPMRGNDIDTDRIIPARYLKEVTFARMGDYPFFDERYDASGKRKDHPFNDPEYKGASILFVNKNFGCGSSREHAPWALQEYGFRAVIASSFADIFFNNCFKNGVLPVVLKEEEMDVLFNECEASEGYQITVDLEQKKVVRPNGESFSFDVDDFRRHCLLNGLDDIGLTLQVADDIRAFEEKAKAARPWVFQSLR